MKNRIKSWILAIVFAASVGGGVFSIVPAVAVSAKAPNCSGVAAFLTFPAWYRGLADVNAAGTGCNITSPDGSHLSGFIWHIVLNVIEIGLQLVIYAAFGLILYGGFQYLTSSGEPAKAATALQTIINAAVGIALGFGSVAAVNLVLGIIK